MPAQGFAGMLRGFAICLLPCSDAPLFAVVDDIDAAFDLLLDHMRDRVADRGVEVGIACATILLSLADYGSRVPHRPSFPPQRHGRVAQRLRVKRATGGHPR